MTRLKWLREEAESRWHNETTSKIKRWQLTTDPTFLLKSWNIVTVDLSSCVVFLRAASLITQGGKTPTNKSVVHFFSYTCLRVSSVTRVVLSSENLWRDNDCQKKLLHQNAVCKHRHWLCSKTKSHSKAVAHRDSEYLVRFFLIAPGHLANRNWNLPIGH